MAPSGRHHFEEFSVDEHRSEGSVGRAEVAASGVPRTGSKST